MSAPLVSLISAAKVELTGSKVAISVREGSADHRAIDKIYAEFGKCRLYHESILTLAKFTEVKPTEGNVVYLGAV